MATDTKSSDRTQGSTSSSTASGTPSRVLVAKNLSAFTSPPKDDPDELIRNRLLCKGAILLVAGPTGIGKSSFDLQCGISWALGKTAFGMQPTRPLRSLFIQSENDDGDVYEFREGIFKGLGLTTEEQAQAAAAVLIHTPGRPTTRG